jgi:nitrous-oxide reductase
MRNRLPSLYTAACAAGAAIALAIAPFACRTTNPTGHLAGIGGTPADASTRVYVPPGSYDEFYAFLSGGYSGQVAVYGLPSGRLLKVIPVFSQFSENGYGYDDESKAMLTTTYGFIPWDDAHHPELSQTNGVPDGRWLFINGNNTPRIARIDLTRFTTEEILQIPNSGGNHSSPFTTPDGKYVFAGTRFSVPIPQQDAAIGEYANKFKGTISMVRADVPGQMDIAAQILVPGFDYDLAHAGKGPSDGWVFFTSYNTEQAHTLLEINASKNDKDYIAALNWRQAERCIADHKGRSVATEYYHNVLDTTTHVARAEKKTSVTMLQPADCPGMLYYIPTPKSPHGVDVDPSGEYIVAGGKLATAIPVHSFSKIQAAIQNKEFDGQADGIPILKYNAVLAGEVKNPGLGPLHTEFDGKGYAYTTMFISSEVVKWKLGTWEVVDRHQTYYSPGHLMIPGGDSRQPWGKYLLALNKITKDRYLPTGPELDQSAQLFDISGDKMQLLADFPTIGEPHYAQALPASLIRDRQLKFYTLAANRHAFVARAERETGIERQGKLVHVRMTAIRSHFAPDNVEGIQVGDTVLFHVTNIEQDWDIPHGFGVMGARTSDLLVMPGETRTLRWVPQTQGVYPFYCTDFCSALHQEMQGYVRVSPAGSRTPLVASTGGTPSTGATGHASSAGLSGSNAPGGAAP